MKRTILNPIGRRRFGAKTTCACLTSNTSTTPTACSFATTAWGARSPQGGTDGGWSALMDAGSTIRAKDGNSVAKSHTRLVEVSLDVWYRLTGNSRDLFVAQSGKIFEQQNLALTRQ